MPPSPTTNIMHPNKQCGFPQMFPVSYFTGRVPSLPAVLSPSMCPYKISIIFLSYIIIIIIIILYITRLSWWYIAYPYIANTIISVYSSPPPTASASLPWINTPSQKRAHYKAQSSVDRHQKLGYINLCITYYIYHRISSSSIKLCVHITRFEYIEDRGRQEAAGDRVQISRVLRKWLPSLTLYSHIYMYTYIAFTVFLLFIHYYALYVYLKGSPEYTPPLVNISE